jgi:branched-chain amino acid transport system substrate-binding protein
VFLDKNNRLYLSWQKGATMNKPGNRGMLFWGLLFLGVIIFSVLVFVGQQTANQLKVQAENTARSAATSMQSTAQAQSAQTLDAVAGQATQAMATANAQATAKIEGTKQIDLNLFPNATIKVAVHLPLSGFMPENGQFTLEGAELALAQRVQPIVNLGFNVIIAPYDDQGNPDIGVANAQQIARDSSILCVVGHLQSGVAIPASEEYHAAGLAMVSPAATKPELTDRGYAEINRIIGRDDTQGFAAAQYAHSQGIQTVFVVRQVGHIASIFKKGAEMLGMNVVGFESAETSEQLSALTDQIVLLNPDAVYLESTYDRAAPFFKSLREKGYMGLLMGPDWLDHPDLLLAGPALQSGKGTVYTVVGDLYNERASFPAIQQFNQDFQAYFGRPPQNMFFATKGYDAMSVCLKGIEDAIRQKGSVLTRDDIARAIRALRDFPGVSTPFISFDSNGDLSNADYPIYQVTATSAASWHNTFLGAIGVPANP